MVYVIIRGLMSCSDSDELKGYRLSEEAAQAYCDEQQALETGGMVWMYDAVVEV